MQETAIKQSPARILHRVLFRFGNILFLAALVFVPLAMNPRIYHPYNVPKLFVLTFFAILLLLTLSLLILTGRKSASIYFGTFPILLAGWVFVHIISALFSANVKFALENSGFAIECALFSFWAFLRARDGRLLRAAAGGLGIVALLTAIYGFAQYAGHDFITLEEPGKPVAFFGNANFATQFLIAVLPLFVAFALTGRSTLFFTATAVLVILQILLLKSRGGILGGTLALIFFGYIVHKIRTRETGAGRVHLIRLDDKKIRILILGIIITGGTFICLNRATTLKEIASAFGTSPQSNRYRIEAWEASLHLARRHPILGVGSGNYGFFIPLYSGPELWKLQGTFSRVRLLHAHNDYVNILCELGIIGLATFFAIMIFLARRFWIFLRDIEIGGSEKIITAGLAVGICATLIQSLFDFNLYNPASGLLFWVMAGFLAGMTASPRPAQKQLPHPARLASGIILLLFSIATLFLVPQRLAVRYRSERLNRIAYVLFSRGDYEKAAGYAAAALKRDAKNLDAVAILADSLRNTENKEAQAVRAYILWASLEPNYVPIYNRLGECYFRLGKIDAARGSFEKALSINPYNVAVLLNLGNLALGMKNPALAVSYYERASKIGGELIQKNQAQYGLALMQLGRFNEAIKHLEKGLSTLPEKAPLILEALGDCYAAIGKKEQAISAYERAQLFGNRLVLSKKISHLKKD